MTSPLLFAATLITLIASAAVPAASAKEILYRHQLTTSERRCLAQILDNGEWRYVPQAHQKMMSVAVVAPTNLNENGRKHYIYVMRDFSFCGTAGCSMLIGEARRDGTCHEIYDDAGSEIAVTILRQRDHGYRRLMTPCEVRFDGREYRKLHEECPNGDVQR